MHAIDTNVLVRLLTRENATQTAAAELFIAKGAWVSVLALVEATWVLGSVYALDAGDQANAIEMLLSHRQLVLQDRETIAAALNRFRLKPGLGFSDCMMLEVARKAGYLPLGTFDRALAKQDGAQKL